MRCPGHDQRVGVPTKAVIAGLAKDLDSDVSYLTKLATEISL
jgi:hypothetical protein